MIIADSKKTAVTLIAILLVVPMVTAAFLQPKSPKTLPWYQVDDWEIDVCSKWGGRKAAEIYETTGRFPYGAASYTMQGRKTRQHQAPTIYEIGYYIEAFSIPLEYKLYLLNDETQDAKYIDGNVLGPGNGISDYRIEQLNEDYTHLRLITPGSIVTTPFVVSK